MSSEKPSPVKPPAIRRCPECRAPCQADQTFCPICQHEILPDVFTAQVAGEETVPRGGNSFSLTTMFIVVAMYAVCFTVWRFEPGSGIAMVIFTTSALAVTAFRGRRHLRRGDEFGKADIIGTFYISFLASIGVWCVLIVVPIVVVWIVMVIVNLIFPPARF